MPEYYSPEKNESYPFAVAKDLYVTKTMKDSLWHWIINAKVREKKPRQPFDYTYSDMGFYIMQHVAEKILNQPMEQFLAQNIYEPMGATTTGFLPLDRFPESQIAPTEVDKQFRGSKLVGYVHDQGAAMHGGVAAARPERSSTSSTHLVECSTAAKSGCRRIAPSPRSASLTRNDFAFGWYRQVGWN